jgi:HAD superfamily hydrolase (TIGR01509 family)
MRHATKRTVPDSAKDAGIAIASACPMAHLKAALLDVDGTLIDSNDAHASAWVEALSEFGHDVTFDRVRQLIGKGGDKLLPETVKVEKDSREGTAISKRRGILFKEKYLPNLRPFPSARELVAALRDRGLRVFIATSATADEITALLDVANVRDLLSDVTTSKDAKESKPDPDIIVAALTAAKCHASEAVMLGDTPYDVEAAVRAGVVAVALRCGGWDDASLEGAAAIYEDPRDLFLKLDTSPFAAR